MKGRIVIWLIVLITVIACLLCKITYAKRASYTFNGLTGTSGTLDAISCTNADQNGRDLADGDLARGPNTSDGGWYVYVFDIDSDLGESVPDVIVPNDQGSCPTPDEGEWIKIVQTNAYFASGTTDPYYPSLSDSESLCYSAQPASIVGGKPYCADNSNWDPCDIPGTDNYLTFWNGSSWVAVMDAKGELHIAGIESPTPTIGDPDTWSLSGASLYGGVWIAESSGADNLPPVGEGMGFTVIVFGSNVVSLNPDSTGTEDTIYLSGTTTLAQGDSIISDGTAGAMCVFQYYAADIWLAMCDSHWSDND